MSTVDDEALVAGLQRVAARCREEPALGATATLLAAVGDREVAAVDLHGQGLDTPVPTIASVTKSLLSTVTGWALADGLVELTTTLHDLLGDPVPPPRRPATVHHLLSMTGGADGGLLPIDDVMELPSGWVPALLGFAQLDVPGSRFRYDNGAWHLLAAGLQRAVGGDLLGYARRVLEPSGCAEVDWPRDPEGVPFGFGDARLSPRQLLAFGRAWADGRAVPDGYRERAWRTYSPGGPPEQRPYGYGWWLSTADADVRTRLAAGWAGQAVLIAPGHGLVLVATGSPERWHDDSSRPVLPLLEELARDVLSPARPGS
ncbi:serine hydrolase domain-containing protein [Desertihabitans aurantiacus]|uniref:serine hydrolase domain-containing protein n=1 Tax=Desertihabitans aurantiacus TaxID=2282477 RepID=UPI000DF7FA7A|nr:serine hydrolase domain-containing protein [Desertihabitans aurantiacus]